MDLDLLKNEHVWASNKINLLFDKISWRPGFYVAVDQRVFPDISQEIEMTTAELPDTKFIFPSLFREQKSLQSADNIYWYRETNWDQSKIPNSTFTTDASKWVAGVTTVTIAAMQLAVYLGFNPIYLIGCDTSYPTILTPPISVQAASGTIHKSSEWFSITSTQTSSAIPSA